MDMLAKIRRMHLRDGLSIREVSRRTGLSRNTVRQWLRQEGVTEPKYPKRDAVSAVDAWAEHLASALKADQHRPVRDRRTIKMLFEQIRALGYAGNVLARLKDGTAAIRELAQPTPVLKEEPRADGQRYDALRQHHPDQQEVRP